MLCSVHYVIVIMFTHWDVQKLCEVCAPLGTAGPALSQEHATYVRITYMHIVNIRTYVRTYIRNTHDCTVGTMTEQTLN